MPLRTSHFLLEYFLTGEPYWVNVESRRFKTLDTQINAVLKNYSNGVINGFEVVKDSNQTFGLTITEGLAILPFFITEEINGKTVVEESNVAVRSFKTTSIILEAFQTYGIYLVPAADEDLTTEIVIVADKNVFRNATPVVSGANAYSKYLLDLPSIDANEDNIEIFINGSKYVGQFELDGQNIIFPNKRLSTDVILVRILPKDSLILAVVETGESEILSIDVSVKTFVSSGKTGKTIPQAIMSHNHKDDGTELSLEKVSLTSKTKIAVGTAIVPSTIDQNANTIYIFTKSDFLSDSAITEDFKSITGTITSQNINYNELINLNDTTDSEFKGYFLNPDISQSVSATILQTNNNGKNLLTDTILTDIIISTFQDEYKYILYPYDIILFINGERQYGNYWLIDDDNEYLQISFTSPLEDDDVVEIQLELITELTQVKGILKIDGLSNYSRRDLGAFFSANNINSGYLPEDVIPRVSHIGRSKELLIPIPTEDDELSDSSNIIYCESTDRINYRPGLKNVPPLKNSLHINKIDNKWYVVSNGTLLTSDESRLFNDLNIMENYRVDSPKPIKTDYIEIDDVKTPCILTEQSFLISEDDEYQTRAVSQQFYSNSNLYEKDDFQYVVPGSYSFSDMEIDRDNNNNIFISINKENGGNNVEIFAYLNKDLNSKINLWNKIYSNNNAHIKDLAVHNGFIYAIVQENGLDSIKRTLSKPSQILSQNGSILTISSSDVSNYSIDSSILISRIGNVETYFIESISTSDDISFLTLDRIPPEIHIEEDFILPDWAVEPRSTENTFDKLFVIGNSIYASSGNIVFEDWSPILSNTSDFTEIYDLNIFNNRIVISTDNGIYYLLRKRDYYIYGYGFGYGTGLSFFDVFGTAGTRVGYGGGTFESDFIDTYGYGYGFEQSFIATWMNIKNQIYDTDVNDIVMNTNNLFVYNHNEDAGLYEIYLATNKGIYQIESLDFPHDVAIRNAFVMLNNSIDYNNNIFTTSFGQGKVVGVDTDTKEITVLANLRKINVEDIVIFDEGSGKNTNQVYRILSKTIVDLLKEKYKIRVDRVDGLYTKNQHIFSGHSFKFYKNSDPLIFINNNPQNTNYNKFAKSFTFDYQTQSIEFDSSLEYNDSVAAISKIKHLYSLRGPWDENLNGNEVVYLNNRNISSINGKWDAIKTVEYYDYSSGPKTLIKEIILETKQNDFIGFNLSGLTITPNNNNSTTYVINSNTFNTIRIREQNDLLIADIEDDILTNSSTDETESINNVSYLINIGIGLSNNTNVLPYGNIGLITLPNPVLTSNILRITIPNTSAAGIIIGSGNYTHAQLQDFFAQEEDGLPYKFSGLKNANLIQFISALKDIIDLDNVTSVENIEITDLTNENVIDLINSTIENFTLYKQEEEGSFSRNVFNIIYSDDLGGTYALTSNGVFFKPTNSNDTTEKWIKKANIVKYMSVTGSPTISDQFKGVFLSYDKSLDKWTIQWGEDFRLEDRNNGLNNHYITALDLDPLDDNKLYVATKQHGAYRTTDGGSSTWEMLFTPGSFDSKLNINSNKYEISDIKVYPSKDYTILVLLKDKDIGGLYLSNDDGNNFEQYSISGTTIGGIEISHQYNFIEIPHIQDTGDLGISPMIYWGSDNIFRKQYGYGFEDRGDSTGQIETEDGHIASNPFRWKIDRFSRFQIDANVNTQFDVLDIAIKESDTNTIFAATTNGLYKSTFDGYDLLGTINDYRFIGNLGSEVFDFKSFQSGESVEQTKLWVTFDFIVPSNILKIGKYFTFWQKPLKLIDYTIVSETQVLLYFEGYDRKMQVYRAGYGFSNEVRGANIRNFSSWVKIGESNFHTAKPTTLLYHDYKLYVGTEKRGIWVSIDDGLNFIEYNEGFSELLADSNLNISQFDVDSESTIYCSTRDSGGFGGGIFKRTAAGWSRIGGVFSGDIVDFTITDGLAQHDITSFQVGLNNSIIYAGTTNGIYKTSNGGTSWSRIALPTEYSNVIKIFSDNKTAFLGTQFSGIYKTTDLGNIWVQDFDPVEKIPNRINNTKKWRNWKLRKSKRYSDSLENNLFVETYNNLYTWNGIKHNREALNINYAFKENVDTGKSYVETINTIPDNMTGTQKYNLPYYEFQDRPGILESSIYNIENNSLIANVNDGSLVFFSDYTTRATGVSNPPSIIKTKDSINNYKKSVSLLLDHNSVKHHTSYPIGIANAINRIGIFTEEKEYAPDSNGFRRIENDILSKSSLADYSISDIRKHSSTSVYYIATENNGVYQVTDLLKLKPTNFYRGVGTVNSSGTTIIDSNIDFSVNDPTGYDIILSTNSASPSLVEKLTIGSISTNTITFSSAASATTDGTEYSYLITNRYITSINDRMDYQDALNNATYDSGDYYDIISSDQAFISEDENKKIHIFPVTKPDLEYTFAIESVASSQAKIKRQRLTFREDGETRLVYNSISNANGITTLKYNSFYGLEESAASWIGMLIQPNVYLPNFYKITNVDSTNFTISISDTNGSLLTEIQNLNPQYSNIYFTIFNNIESIGSNNYSFIITNYATFTQLSRGLVSFESEYEDDNGNKELDIKFNKLYHTNNTLYAATEKGVWKYNTVSGDSWEEINTGLQSFAIKDIVGGGTNGEQYLYAATFGNGVYRSTNQGSTWVSINTGLNHKKVWDLSIHPSNPDQLLAATKDGGIYITNSATTGSASWSTDNSLVDRRDIKDWKVKSNPIRPRELYAWAYGAGVYKSSDSGSTWLQFNNGLTNLDVLDLDICPDDGRIIAATDGAGLFELAFNNVWLRMIIDKLPHPVINKIKFSYTNSNIYFITCNKPGDVLENTNNDHISDIYHHNNPNILYRTFDDGKSWTKVYEPTGQTIHTQYPIEFDSDNTLYIADDKNIYTSNNLGDTLLKKTDISEINKLHNATYAGFYDMKVNQNQTRNIVLSGYNKSIGHMLFVSRDFGKIYEPRLFNNNDLPIYDVSCSTISKETSTQTVNIVSTFTDQNAVIKDIKYNNNYSTLTIEYDSIFENDLLADFGGALLNISGESTRYDLVNKAYNINDYQDKLYTRSNLNFAANKTFKIDGLYSVQISITSDDLKINGCMVNNYIKINDDIYKIAKWVVSGSTASVTFIDSTQSITTGTLSNASITIGSLNLKGTDIEDIPVIYTTNNSILKYSLNYGYYWITSKTFENNSTEIEFLADGIQGVVSGENINDALFIYAKNDNLYQVSLNNNRISTSQILSEFPNVLKDGLARSSSTLYVSTSDNIKYFDSSLSVASALSLPTFAEIQIPLKIAKSNSDYGIYFADNKLYSSTDLSNWSSKSININNINITNDYIKFIKFDEYDENKLYMSVNIDGDISNINNGLYVSPNMGGTWRKLQFNFDNNNLLFSDIQTEDGNNYFISAEDDNNTYILTNTNGILGQSTNGFFYSENLWISSTPDGLTIYTSDDSSTNEFSYKFTNFPLYYWQSNPKTFLYDKANSRIVVGTSKGLEFYDLSISDTNVPILSNHVIINSGLVSNDINNIRKSTFNNKDFYVVCTSNGLHLIPAETYSAQSSYITENVSLLTNEARSNNILDGFVDGFNRTVFITSDSIYIREFDGSLKYISSNNSSLGEQVITSIDYKSVPLYTINYSDKSINFININSNLYDFQNFVVIKTLGTSNVVAPTFGVSYLNSLYGTVENASSASGQTTVTLTETPESNDTNTRILIVNPNDANANQYTVQSIDVDSRTVVIGGSINIKSGDKYILADKINNSSYVIYSGSDAEFNDLTGTQDSNLTYSFYYKKSNGSYIKLHSTTTSIDSTSLFEGTKTTFDPYIYIGTNMGIVLLNSESNDIIETAAKANIRNLKVDQNNRILVSSSNGLYKVTLNNSLETVLLTDNINNYSVNNIYISDDGSKILIDSNNAVSIVNNSLNIVNDTLDNEISYDTLRYNASDIIPRLKIYQKFDNINGNKFSIVDGKINIYNNNKIIRSTSNKNSIVKSNIINNNESQNISGNVLYALSGSINSSEISIISDDSNVFFSFNNDEYYIKSSTPSESTIYNIYRTTLVDDILFLTTDDYRNKLIKISDVSPYNLRPTQGSNVNVDFINSSNGLQYQTIYSVLHNSTGTELWAGGFGSLYYRASSDTDWTEINYSSDSLSNPFFIYSKLEISSKSGNPIYAIVENIHNNNSNIKGKNSSILLIDKGDDFTADLVVNGNSFEYDSGRYSTSISAQSYSNSYFNLNKPNYNIFGLGGGNSTKDININSILEINSGNNVLYGANKNNLRLLTYYADYERDGLYRDVSIQLGFVSIENDNFELPSAFEKSYAVNSSGILEKIKPVRCIDIFESNYDPDILVASIFNPGELPDANNKIINVTNNSKSLDHDFGYILMSQDGGINWSRIAHNIPGESIISDVVVTGNGIIYVSVFGCSKENSGVWISTNNGKTFSSIRKNLPKQPVKSLYFVEKIPGYPEFGGILYAGLWGGGIYKINTTGYGYGYGYAPFDFSGYSYGYGYEALLGSYSFFDVFSFNFETELWQEIQFDIGVKKGKNLTASNVLDISQFKNDYHESAWAITEDDGVLYSDNRQLFNLGKKWIQRNEGLLTADLNVILNSQFNESDVWLGTSSGFYKFNPDTNEWDHITNGIPSSANILSIEHDTYFFNTFNSLTWDNVDDSDGTLIFRTTSFISTDIPIDGKTYSQGDKVGDSIAIYSGSGDYSSTPLLDTSSTLDPGREYFYSFYSYTGSGRDRSYTKFPDKLTGEIKYYDPSMPNEIELSTFKGTVTSVVNLTNTNNVNYGDTQVLLDDRDDSGLAHVLASKSSLLVGYKLIYNYGTGQQGEAEIIKAFYEGIIVDGYLADTIDTGNCVIVPYLSNDDLIGYVFNPSESQNSSFEIVSKPIVFNITDNTDTTITIGNRNDRKQVKDVTDLVVNKYVLPNGSTWTGFVEVRRNGQYYTRPSSLVDTPYLLTPIYGPNNRNPYIRESNTFKVPSDKLFRAKSITPLYVGTTDGIYRSTDNGNEFEFIGLSGIFINDIVISAENLKDRTLQTANDAIVYATTNSGLYKSSDGGNNWTQIGTGTFGSNNLKKIIIEKVFNKEYIYVNYPNHGIYKSSDEGDNWSEIAVETSSLDINDLDISKLDSKQLLLTTSGDGIKSYIEPDNEIISIEVITDNKIKNVSDISLHIGDDIHNYKDRFEIISKLRRSESSNMKSVSFQTDHDDSIEIKVKKNNKYINPTDISVGSSNLNPYSNPFRVNKVDDEHYPTHVFTTSILTNGDLFVGTNQGGYITKDGGNSWHKAGNYLMPSKIYSSGVLDDDRFYIGTNNGLWVSNNNGQTFTKDQMAGNNVRTIWSHEENGIRRFFIASDAGVRIISLGESSITIKTPETFNSTDGVIFSWGGKDENGNFLIGGMPKDFLEFLNVRREYWIQGSQNNPIYSRGWEGILVVRTEGSESSFVPQNDANYGIKYRRFIEVPEWNTFFDPPPIRPFPDGLVTVALITNNTNELDEGNNKFISSAIIGNNTYTPDVPFIDYINITSEYDRNPDNKWGAYPEQYGDPIDQTKIYEFGNGAELKADTFYTYAFFAFFLRPTPIPYDIKKIGELYKEYYQFTPEEWTYDIKINNMPSAKQIFAGDSLSVNEWVVATDDGVFYSSSGTDINRSNGFADGTEVNAILAIETTDIDYVYGYGWGNTSINFFDVFDVSGNLIGYGSSEFDAAFHGSYGYGWGYEERNLIKIFAGAKDGIYISVDRGVTFSRVFETQNSEIDIIYNFIQQPDGTIQASTNQGILTKSTASDAVWFLEPVIGSADHTIGDRILGQSIDINEVL